MVRFLNILRESLCQIRAPAEAEKYRLEKIAEAEKSRTVLEAEAEVIFFIRVSLSTLTLYHPYPIIKKCKHILFLGRSTSCERRGRGVRHRG